MRNVVVGNQIDGLVFQDPQTLADARDIIQGRVDEQVLAFLRTLRELQWNTLYQHIGFRWEALEHVKVPSGARVYSLRLSQRIRAVAFRDGDFLRFISLHPDHDSAYARFSSG
jgi:hypothetical protein